MTNNWKWIIIDTIRVNDLADIYINALFMNAKYDNQTILTDKEADNHLSIDDNTEMALDFSLVSIALDGNENDKLVLPQVQI